MNPHRIAVVGIACRYPDTDSPDRLWENVLAGRRAFRRLPDERMRLDDYYSPDPAAPDRFYTQKAAVLEGFEFDRVKHRVAGSTYRSTDLTHWLALDTAANALADAGFPDGEGLPARSTGVVIGNSLAGEFSRASMMRLRWPYVRRTVGAALREQGWDDQRLGAFLDELEGRYKSPFPPADEDMLAGGLANTIAGRICNHFDFKGGGYTVDGACSSSLLSVATACNALVDGQLDAVVAGGVDLSIDPFEVIGFAKTGALAKSEMRVYDKGSNGFWPGEGCGMLVLMRDQDAVDRGLFRYATIAGWGYSSDGKGGITRPEAQGHRLAMQRAYASAGFGITSVSYFEGHGTGTAVGDATELRAFSEERRAADPDAPPAAISTVKGNFGHTKAAAGVAGLLKAILAVRHQVIPPATSHVDPHPELTGEQPALRVPSAAELWPKDMPVRAAVSSMGFGGINAHVIVEHADGARRVKLPVTTRKLVRSRQDCELFMLDADSIAELRGRVTRLAAIAPKLSYAELADLAGTLHRELADRPFRAAVIARSPEEAERRFEQLLTLLDGGARAALDDANEVFLGRAGGNPRVGFLFPGQGAGRRGDGGAIRHRFEEVEALYLASGLPTDGDLVATAVAQPRIVTSSVAGLRVLARLGISASAAAGHSLGELTALHWAGAMDEPTLLSVASARGRIMGETGDGDGAMASLAASPDDVRPLLAGEPVVIAGFNSPRQTVVSGPAGAVERVRAQASAAGLDAVRLSVSHAFHSEGVAPAAEALREHLGTERFGPVSGRIVSTVTADDLAPDEDVRELLRRQVLDPVRFAEAVEKLAAEVDLLVEVGPGRALTGLAADIAPSVPAVSMETDSPSLSGLMRTVATAYVLGADLEHEALWHDRFVRPLDLDKEFRFLANPCESAPEGDFAIGTVMGSGVQTATTPAARPAAAVVAVGAGQSGESGIDVLRRLAAERAELPLEAVRPDSQPLDELHLSSITVGQIVNLAARELGITAPMTTSAFATSTLEQLAQMLEELADTASSDDRQQGAAPGVAPWVRSFAVELRPARRGPAVIASGGDWQMFATAGHPIADHLYSALRKVGLGGGVLLCLPEDCDEQHVPMMLESAQAALGMKTRYVVVGDRRNASGLAKTLHLETPSVTTTVITLPLPADLSLDRIAAVVSEIVTDVAATEGFSEIHYDADGGRCVPVLTLIPPAAETSESGESGESAAALALGPDDVLLVTGGGKGITAECALAVARDTGAAVGLLGRSDPAKDAELAANLRRLATAGVRCHYARADVTRADEVRAAIEEIRRVLGPVTGVLHGAGRNEPHALSALDETSFRRTLAPKVAGLEAVLAATDPGTLRLLVTFGSIIGRAGLRGEADYAVANDWLTDLTARFQEQYPDCRCLALEWSVWSGSGMGERLGVLESLIRQGISPIRTEDGVDFLQEVLNDPRPHLSRVVMGRAEGLPTIQLERPELPLLRFLERPQVHYPGIELVVDADLSATDDPYLADHLLDGDLLYPAVLGMEAMVQAAQALTGRQGAPLLSDMEFLRPVVIPIEGTTTIRIAALVTGDGIVEVVIRSSDTGFQADHFRATVTYPRPAPDGAGLPSPSVPGSVLDLRPHPDLYGPVLFQGKRFQRLRGYRRLAAKGCVADLSNVPTDPWFAGFLPAELVLGDPGTRDAVMHSLQCCVPDATLLPAGIERLYLADPAASATRDTMVLHATERSRNGDTYIYDLDVRAEDGDLVERWEGLRLQAVRKKDGSGPWLPSLLGPYLERRTEQVLPVWLRCAVVADPPDSDGAANTRRSQTAAAVGWALGGDAELAYRPDGKPELDNGFAISASHGAGVTFAVVGEARGVGCDVEEAVTRAEDEWADLLGPDAFALARLVARERGEEFSLAATRVWGAVECLRKAGRAKIEPLVAEEPRADAWVVLKSGTAVIASFVTTLLGAEGPVVFSMMAQTNG